MDFSGPGGPCGEAAGKALRNSAIYRHAIFALPGLKHANGVPSNCVVADRVTTTIHEDMVCALTSSGGPCPGSCGALAEALSVGSQLPTVQTQDGNSRVGGFGASHARDGAHVTLDCPV